VVLRLLQDFELGSVADRLRCRAPRGLHARAPLASSPALPFEDRRCVSLPPTRSPLSRSTSLRSAPERAPTMAEAGQACHHRVPAAPSSLASYRVRHHLRRRAPLLLAQSSLLLLPSGHRRQAVSPRPLACKWPSRLGLPLDKPSYPLDALGPAGARAALPRRRRPSSGWVPPSPPAIPCSLWLKEDEGHRATIREKGGT